MSLTPGYLNSVCFRVPGTGDNCQCSSQQKVKPFLLLQFANRNKDGTNPLRLQQKHSEFL